MAFSGSIVVSIAGLISCCARYARGADVAGSCPSSLFAGDAHKSGESLLQTRRDLALKTKPSESDHYDSAKGRSTRYAALESQVHDVESEGVAVIVPGLGSEERAALVERNIQWLMAQDVAFECWIYVYKSELEFPLETSRFEPCQVIRHAGQWLDHMLELPLNETRKPWILHMEDGTEPVDVSLRTAFEIMKANNLGHASPTIDLQNDHITPTYTTLLYPILARQENYTVGRFVDFIEMHFDIFTRKYYACLQDHIDASSDNITIGWGMDRLLPAFCGGAIGGSEVEAGYMGLLDHMSMVKRYYGSYDTNAARQGNIDFFAKHPDTQGPRFATLGELKAPAEPAAPQAPPALKAAVARLLE